MSYFFFLSVTVFDSISSKIDEVPSINPPPVLSLESSASIIRIGLPILVERTDLVIISDDLTQMVNFPTQIPDCDSHSPAILDLILSGYQYCSAMAFPPLQNSDHAVVSVSIDFPSNSQQDAPFHCIVSDYSHADWEGLLYHLRDVPWGGHL